MPTLAIPYDDWRRQLKKQPLIDVDDSCQQVQHRQTIYVNTSERLTPAIAKKRNRRLTSTIATPTNNWLRLLQHKPTIDGNNFNTTRRLTRTIATKTDELRLLQHQPTICVNCCNTNRRLTSNIATPTDDWRQLLQHQPTIDVSYCNTNRRLTSTIATPTDDWRQLLQHQQTLSSTIATQTNPLNPLSFVGVATNCNTNRWAYHAAGNQHQLLEHEPTTTNTKSTFQMKL